MRYHIIRINLFECSADTDGDGHINILEIEAAEWNGALFHLGRSDRGCWSIEIAYTRQALFALRDWWNER